MLSHSNHGVEARFGIGQQARNGDYFVSIQASRPALDDEMGELGSNPVGHD